MHKVCGGISPGTASLTLTLLSTEECVRFRGCSLMVVQREAALQRLRGLRRASKQPLAARVPRTSYFIQIAPSFIQKHMKFCDAQPNPECLKCFGCVLSRKLPVEKVIVQLSSQIYISYHFIQHHYTNIFTLIKENA